MPLDVPRPVRRQVDVRRHDAAAVAAHDLHRDAHGALRRPADVAAIPRHAERHLRVDADGGEHEPAVLRRRAARAREQREARERHELEGEEGGAALPHAVGEVARAHGEDAGADV